MDESSLKNILSNIDLARKNIDSSDNVKIVSFVTGSGPDRDGWDKRLDYISKYIFNRDGSTKTFSFQEKINDKTKEGNFLGTLLMYSYLKEEAKVKGIDYGNNVSLTGMMFGRGERISPFTQIEGGCKPAIISGSVHDPDGERVRISEIEEALMFFAPVAKYMEDGGFRGIINKWGDETQIPAIDLTSGPGDSNVFSEVDLIKFASVVKVTEDQARHRDWVVYKEDGSLIAQLSRNHKNILTGQLKTLGMKPDKDGEYYAGISLGPVAVSYRVLDIAEEVFRDIVLEKGVHIDFDPYVIMAFAMRGDRHRWNSAVANDKVLGSIAGEEGMIPDLFDRVSRVRDIFEERYGKELNIKVKRPQPPASS
jgi:hypothetical protein